MYSSKFCIYIFAGYSQGDRILHWWPRTWFQFLYSILLHWQNRGLTNAIWLLGQGSPNTFKRFITCISNTKNVSLKILTWCRPKKTGGSNYKPVDLHSPLDQTPKGKSWAKNTEVCSIVICILRPLCVLDGGRIMRLQSRWWSWTAGVSFYKCIVGEKLHSHEESNWSHGKARSAGLLLQSNDSV